MVAVFKERVDTMLKACCKPANGQGKDVDAVLQDFSKFAKSFNDGIVFLRGQARPPPLQVPARLRSLPDAQDEAATKEKLKAAQAARPPPVPGQRLPLPAPWP